MSLDTLQIVFAIVFVVVAAFLGVAGLVRFIGLFFSSKLREAFFKQPLLHYAWFLIAALILALLFLPPSHHVGNAAKRVVAKNDVTQIVASLKAYRTQYGTLPEGGNASIMKTLLGDNPGKVMFIDVPPKSLDAAGEFTDPWGTPYRIDTSNPDFSAGVFVRPGWEG
jgi:hypothetical protein